MRSDVLKRHEASHARRVLITKKKEEREFKHQTLKEQLFRIIGEEKLNELLHVFHRTDCFVEGKSTETVQSKFTTKESLACTCGVVAGECPHPHRHFLGSFNGQGTHYSRAMEGIFTEPKAFMARQLHGKTEGTVTERITRIKHFIHTACYIQTKRGWHKKLGHENPNTFETLEDNKRFLAEMYGDWMWAQVSYMRDLMKKMERLENKKIFGTPTKEQEEKINRKIEDMDQRLQDLEARWGEEHHYKDEEIEADLALFIAECKL